MAHARADVLGAMVGVTTGGLTDAQRRARSSRGCARPPSKHAPTCLYSPTAAPSRTPTRLCTRSPHSDTDGYATGSSGERLPIERAAIDTTTQLQADPQSAPVRCCWDRCRHPFDSPLRAPSPRRGSAGRSHRLAAPCGSEPSIDACASTNFIKVLDTRRASMSSWLTRPAASRRL
jgi:hypothetical protein